MLKFRGKLLGQYNFVVVNFRQTLLVSKTFSGFPALGVQNCILFKVELLVLSNSVLPEREIQEMFY